MTKLWFDPYLTLLYATQRVARYRWRGAYGGVLPDGYDPNSLAAEACRQFLESRRPKPPYRRSAQLRAAARELRRLVRNQISALHRRKENSRAMSPTSPPLLLTTANLFIQSRW